MASISRQVRNTLVKHVTLSLRRVPRHATLTSITKDVQKSVGITHDESAGKPTHSLEIVAAGSINLQFDVGPSVQPEFRSQILYLVCLPGPRNLTRLPSRNQRMGFWGRD